VQQLAGDTVANHGVLNLIYPDDFENAAGLTRLRRCFRLIELLGISVDQLVDWHLPNLAGDIATDAEWTRAQANADAVKNVVKAKFDDDQWLTLAKPLRDGVRERQRSALVAYLLAHKQYGVDEGDLYDYFLLDVEMGSCMMTTRLMQAVCSVQLFVQRCLMNLEPGVALTPDQAKEWHTWRRLQRVWEANREVFLYPENWLDPTLRDDKSPFFKDLESELQQHEVTDDAAETAVLHYLEKLDQVARLEIVGLCLQHDPADTKNVDDVLHVFGRTYASPHLYFYRHFDGPIDKGRWSAWEKIDLDVTADQLVPAVWNRHLYLFWPVFTEKTDPATKDQRANNEDPSKHWEIKLAWSEYKNGRWLPKRLSEQPLTQQEDPSPSVPQKEEDFAFHVQIRQRDPLHNPWDVGFTGTQLIVDCYGTTVTPPPPPAAPQKPPDSLLITMPAWQQGYDDYSGIFNTTGINAIVNKTDGNIKVFNKEHPGSPGSGMLVIPGGYLDVQMVVPWANGQNDFNGNHFLEIDGDNGLLYAVWQSNNNDGDWVRYSSDGMWHDQGNHAGMIRGNHALVVTPLSVSTQGLRELVTYTFQFQVEGQPLRQSEMSSVTLEARWQQGGAPQSRQLALGNNGVVTTAQDARYDEDVYLISDRFTVDPNNGVSVSQHYVNFEVVGRTVTVSLVAAQAQTTQTSTSGPAFQRMQAIGCFVSSDCHNDFMPMPVAGATQFIQPLSLEPPIRMKYVDMMMVEQPGSTDTFGTLTVVLTQTPGIFRVLTKPDDYHANRVTFPFAYQDDQRTYLTTATPYQSGAWTLYRSRFNVFFHPRVCAFLEDLDQSGLPGLLDLSTQTVADPGVFISLYGPQAAVVDLDVPGDATRRTPREDVDFSYGGAYSLYNWELFFHIPLLIATKLTKNQRFEEARTWFHYIFDPTSAQPGGRERFWRFKPFFDEAGQKPQTIGDFISKQSQALDEQMLAWEAHPFQPHVIARLRVLAYMKSVVMKYVDNLIQWGDQLFSRDTLENVNEATQLYLLALRVLGKRPDEVPPRATPVVQTFESLDSLAASGTIVVNAFGEALVDIEDYLPPSASSGGLTSGSGGGSLGQMPLFCLPQNDTLLGYWDTIADRLYKIRHCQNIQGVTRDLPIFAPKIDPGLLVQAAAAGVDLDSVLSDLSAPLPSYRFSVMHQKAEEICGDVRALGAALLTALEKRDAETLALLRSQHEVDLLKAVRQVKAQQVREASNALDALNKYEDVVIARQQYYLGRPFVNELEAVHLMLSGQSLLTMLGHVGAETIAGVLHLIPETKGGAPTTAGVTFGGSNVASAVQAFGGAVSATAGIMSSGAALAATVGGYQRRMDDWAHQADLATKELEQVKKQIAAAEIRLAIANLEMENHDLQIDHAKAVDDVMHEKYTNDELYDWMVGQISAVYFQSYKLAYDAAKRAERCYRFELGLADSRFIQFGYWDSLKKGLLAGEQLQLDLRRLEVDYFDRNAREYEITKPISLLLQDPVALIRLKETGHCEFELPEWMFDLDYPGQYLRRIKSVGLTIPCVAGPYTTVNATLTLLTNKTRVKSAPPVAYPDAPGDSRFVTDFGARQSIATSHGQTDNGLFELNFRDDRYLPFEGMGAISRWRIDMPQEHNGFDLDTITDVVLHLRFTARDGGDALRDAARTAVRGLLTQQTPLVRSFSLRHEFPTEWNRFVYSTALVDTTNDKTHEGVDQRLQFDLSNRFPFQRGRGSISIDHALLFLRLSDDVASSYSDGAPLVVDFGKTAAGVVTTVKANVSLLGSGSQVHGLPVGQLFSGGSETPGTWEVRVVETRRDDTPAHAKLRTGTDSLPAQLRESLSIANSPHYRLKPGAVQDIMLVCVYRLQ